MLGRLRVFYGVREGDEGLLAEHVRYDQYNRRTHLGDMDLPEPKLNGSPAIATSTLDAAERVQTQPRHRHRGDRRCRTKNSKNRSVVMREN